MRRASGGTWGLGARLALLGVLLGAGCDGESELDAGPPLDDAGPRIDAGVDAGEPEVDAGAPCVGPPGLYADDRCAVVAAGVRAYEPRFSLWADGADKERYVALPPGETIDTSDPDNWVYPVGTRMYKTFLQDGVRLETRVFEKTSPGTGVTAWRMRVYAWNEAQDAVEEVTDSPADRREDVLGTDHDIPNGEMCIDCHSGRRDVINGFSAIMLNHDDDGVTLQTLLDEGRLSDPIAPADAEVPGDDETTRDALGYLHANCGYCHGVQDGGECLFLDDQARLACNTGMHTWLDVGTQTLEDSAVYRTAVNTPGAFRVPMQDALCRVHPGSPDTSTAVLRMEHRDDPAMPMLISQMPPLATEHVDTEGAALIRRFIAELSVPVSPDCTP